VKFQTTYEQQDKIRLWLEEVVYPQLIEQQKKTHSNDPIYEDCWEMGYPYMGAIGGGLTYCFTPTSLGVIFKVKFLYFELDLTDYDSW